MWTPTNTAKTLGYDGLIQLKIIAKNMPTDAIVALDLNYVPPDEDLRFNITLRTDIVFVDSQALVNVDLPLNLPALDAYLFFTVRPIYNCLGLFPSDSVPEFSFPGGKSRLSAILYFFCYI